MSERKVWLPKYWYWLLLFATILLSAGGVILATLFNRTSQAGLGGALSVALSFAALWVKDDLSDRLLSIFQTYRKSTEGVDAASQPQILEERLDELEAVFWWRTTESRRQNVTLALASVIGTLTWALGEPLANVLRRLL